MIEPKIVKRSLVLKGTTAKVELVVLKNGKRGFLAESLETGRKVAVRLNKKDIKRMTDFFNDVGVKNKNRRR